MNAIQRHYVYEPGATTPFLWYEGTGLTDRRWLHADERGSIIAVSNGTGNALAINRYDDWGIPDPGNIGRFQFTGHAWLPEAGLYYARARIYSPTLGRFLQTDPIGYGDGMNLYNYVGSDPINGVDPTGLAQQFSDIVVKGYPAQPGPWAVVSPVTSPILHRIGYEIGRFFRCLFGGCKKPQPAAKAKPKAEAKEPAEKTKKPALQSHCISPLDGPVIFAGSGFDAVLGTGAGFGFYKFTIPTTGATGWVSTGSWLFVAGGGFGVSGGSVKTWGQFEGKGYRAAAGSGEILFDAQGNVAGGAGAVGKTVGAYGGLTKTKLLSSNMPICGAKKR